MDPRFARWRRPWSPEEDVAPYRHLTMEQRGELIAGLCRLAAATLEGRPDRAEVLARKEPRSPLAEAWWREAVRRARSR